MKRKTISLAVCSFLVAGLFSGCATSSLTTSKDDLEKLKTAQYPIETDVELSLFHWQGGSGWDQIKAEDGAKRIIDLLEEKTGIKVKRIYPPVGQEEQQFNIMLASGEYPDIIGWKWGEFVGGADKAVRDGYIVNLNELIDEYSPNFKKMLENDPYIDKMVKTDEGNYCYYPGLTEHGEGKDNLLLTSGYVFRKDWLDELELPVPETIDDWHQTLTAFKEKKGAISPLCMTAMDAKEGLAGAFGINLGFYKDDAGKIQYGFVQPAFKDFVTMMNQWYSEGLIDKNIADIDSKTVDSRLLNDETGAVFAWLGGGMGKWLTAAKGLGMEKFNLVGVPAPVINKGDRAKYAARELPVATAGHAISATSEHKELAIKFLDYGYSEEGHMVYNFGEEGVTYEMIDGFPTYTPFMTNNPNGKSFDDQLSIYTHALGKGPYIMDNRYITQRYFWAQQKEAQKNWGNNDVVDYQLPVLTPSEADSKEFANIMNNINTYTSEMYLKFIVGTKPISEFDSFVQQIRDYGIDRAIKIQQDALDRFNNR